MIGIDQGISVLMAENLRSGFVWNTFMRNRESVSAMQLAGFKGSGLEEEAKNLREKVPSTGR